MVAEVEAATVLVAIENAAVFAPAWIFTLAGTVAVIVALLPRVITAPAGGAAPFRRTVPFDAVPPVTVVGFRTIDARAAGATFSDAVRVVPPYAALIVTAVFTATPFVETVNRALVAPAATSTLAGATALALLDASATVAPPDGAALLRVTVPDKGLPPTMDADPSANVASAAGVVPPETTSGLLTVFPLYIALIVTVAVGRPGEVEI